MKVSYVINRIKYLYLTLNYGNKLPILLNLLKLIRNIELNSNFKQKKIRFKKFVHNNNSNKLTLD